MSGVNVFILKFPYLILFFLEGAGGGGLGGAPYNGLDAYKKRNSDNNNNNKN